MEVKLVTNKEDLNLLQPQLTNLYRQLNPELAQLPLETILEAAQNTDVAVCLDGKVLVGISLMARYKVMIEDVVVAEGHRGKGIGKKLMGLLLEEAETQGLDDVLLFSGHHRTAAIAMYKGLGFTLKNSGLYIKKLNA